MISFVAPLVFVLSVTMIKEFMDDNARRIKDREINQDLFLSLDVQGGKFNNVQSQKLRVGDLVVLNPDERAPADLILLWTSDEQGSVFIRTD